MRTSKYYVIQLQQFCFDFFQPPMNVSLSSPSASVVGDPRMAKLVHAHRVGMIAMETMGNRNLDDNRSYAKFSQVANL